jgi:cardiolipin synthase
MDHAYLEEMRAAGVEVEEYHPLRWFNLNRLNNRTHRKLLVVDGTIGFTGGVGIADEWSGHAQDPNHWRDTHFRIEGPAVAQLQTAFMDNWIKTSGRVLSGPHYYPKLEAKGPQRAQVFKSSSNDGSEGMRLMYLLALAAAEAHIQLSAAYFVPDDLTVHTLVDAMKRGVRLQIIVPGKYIDFDIVRQASRARWGELLQAGAEIFEYQPTMYHCKVMIIDGLFVSVGSTNFDNRSFRLNDEANLNVYDPDFAEQQSAIFQKDLALSRRMTDDIWRHRPWTERILDAVAALFRFEL